MKTHLKNRISKSQSDFVRINILPREFLSQLPSGASDIPPEEERPRKAYRRGML